MRKHHLFWYFLIGWGLFGLLQAALTGIDPDEAYYWRYAQQLDWGYFDHPPAIAVMIAAGNSLFAGTLGIRFFTVLIQLIAFYFIWVLAGQPRETARAGLLMLLLTAMPLLQIFGFVATPDSPLLFFATVYFFLLQRFLEKNRWTDALFLGLSMALMLYSKYHGVLIIFLTLLPHLPKLLVRPQFYAACLLGAALFVPHLYWQYANDFPSFRYHLKGRNDPYELKHTLNYLINQLLVFSPLIFPLIVATLFRRRPQDALERSFYWLVVGFWVFFFWTTFKGHAEPHWTAVLSIPFVLLLYRTSLDQPRMGRWVWRMALTSAVVLIIARLLLMLPIPGLETPFDRGDWVYALQREANGTPVVFQNSYRDAAVYTFFSGDSATTITDNLYRKNQYDLWLDEVPFYGRSVLLTAKNGWGCAKCIHWTYGSRQHELLPIEFYQPNEQVHVVFTEEQPVRTLDSVWTATLDIYHPYPFSLELHTGILPLKLYALYVKNAAVVDFVPVASEPVLEQLPPGDTIRIQARFSPPDSLMTGLGLAFGLRWGNLPPPFSSAVRQLDP